MALSASRIIRIGETEHAHEREGLHFIEQALPSSEPFAVWELFEFQHPATGRLLEVDALVLGYSALYLVELKGGPGLYEGNQNDWYRTPPGEPPRYMEAPFSLANKKAKILKSRLEARLHGQRLPRIEALVFLSAESVELRFEDEGGTHVVTRKDFARAVQFHQFPGAPRDWEGRKIGPTLARDIAATLQKLGIRPRKAKLHVNEWQLGPVLHDTEVYQDREAQHRERSQWKARARVYLVPLQTTVEHRQKVRRAADREAALLYELRDHPNILRTTSYATDAELGPTVIFDHFDGQPLDAFIRKNPNLSFDDRIAVIEQVGRALAYCHQKHIAHGAVSPYAVLVRKDPGKDIETKLFNFQLGRGQGVQTTSHLTAFTEPPWRVYQAPEVDAEGQADDEEAQSRRGPSADLFGLGALAYFTLTGQHPATTRRELLDRLERDSNLDPRTVNDTIAGGAAELVTIATAKSALYRGEDVADWVELLREVIQPPEPVETAAASVPLEEARKGDRISDNLELLGPLGQGATSRVLRVRRLTDGRELALKCSLSEDHDKRLAAEGKLLEDLAHQNVVQLIEVLRLGGRTCLLLTLAGSETLHASLARDGIVSLDYASRYGQDLLAALEFLEQRGVLHRDIKPANLGVGSGAGKERKQLTLFDFSLAAATPKDIQVGTSAYREPFLRERGVWDAAADRWSAAVTLHELLTAARPTFAEGKTALDADAEIQVLAERFDPAVRTRLAAFFKRAFERQPEKRFASAQEMGRAWVSCFDERKGAEESEGTKDETPATPLENITGETPVAALPLSSRARAALDRAGILHARGLLGLPENSLSAIRGVGRGVAREILEFRDRWRALGHPTEPAAQPFFPDFRGADILVRTAKLPEALAVALEDAGLRTLGRVAQASAAQVQAVAQRAGVEAAALRECLTAAAEHGAAKERPTTLAGWLAELLPKKPERARYFELLFGLVSPFEGQLDVRAADVARELGVTRARVSQSLDAARDDWAQHGALPELRALAHGLLEGLGGIAPIREAGSLLAQRLSAESAGLDALAVARGAALLRVVAEVERGDAAGLRLQRVNEGLWLALGSGLHQGLERLGAEADALARSSVLASPGEVQRRLAQVAADSALARLLPDRLAQLAAHASRGAACSPRLELYPRGMAAERALELSSSVLRSGMSAEQVRRLVMARYPEAAPLPARPALDDLLGRYELFHSEVEGQYLRPHERHAAQSTSFQPLGTVQSTASTSQPRAMNAPAIAARELDEQLGHTLDRGLFRVLAVSVADAHEAALRLVERKGLRRVRLDELLLKEMKALMSEKRVADSVVHEADRVGPSSKGWPNLTRLAAMAAERALPALLPRTDEPLLYTEPGLVARYDLGAFLERIVAATGQAEVRAAFLLVPTHEPAGVPRIEGTLPIPSVLPSQVLRISREWLHNLHNAAA